jgi:hypothetical protein
MDIEEYGEPFETARIDVINAIGDRTIVGHSISEIFMQLDYLPRNYKNNYIIDIAHDNRINFEVMVMNNQRHVGFIGKI